jgi:hypothetical protein
MKKTNYFLFILLLGVISSYGQEKALEGTWKFISGTITSKDSTFPFGATEAMKIVTPTHFAVISKSADGNFQHAAAGRVKKDDKNYSEMLEYSSAKDLKTKSAVYTYTLEGNKWHIKGGFDDMKLDEIWERVQ